MPFKNKLEDYFKTKLASWLTDYSFIVTNDGTEYLSNDSEPLEDNQGIAILSYGNATPTRYNDFIRYDGSISITLIVPFNKREEITDTLDTKLKEISITDDNIALDSLFYVSFRFNTASCDGIKRIIKGKEYANLIILGTISYSDYDLSYLKMDKVELDGVELKNIVSEQFQRTSSKDSQVELGKMFANITITNESQVVTITFLIDKTNTLHKKLLNTNKCFVVDGSILPSYGNAKITSRETSGENTGTFKALYEFNTTIELGNLTAMSLILTR